MTKERMGEIALALIKDHIHEHGFTVSQQGRRNLGSVAKRTGISLDELVEFARPLLSEVLEASFAPPAKK